MLTHIRLFGRVWEMAGANAKTGLLGLKIIQKAHPQTRPLPFRSGTGGRKLCAVTETKVMWHKVVAGCDRYPRDPLLNQMASSLRGRNYILFITVALICRIDPGTKLVLKKYLMKGSTETCYDVDGPWKHKAKWKKPVTKDHHISYDSIYFKCLE